MKFAKEQLEQLVPELKKKHDDIHLLTAKLNGEAYQVIARVPTSAEYQRFMDMGADPKKRSQSVDTIARAAILAAADGDMEQLFERLPGLITTFGGELLELAGLVDDVEAKKL